MAKKLLTHDDALAKVGTDTASVVERIDHMYRITPYSDRLAGHKWYREALREATRLADTYGITVEQSVGIISALSPRMPWSRNVAVAESVIATRTGKALGRNVAKALSILDNGLVFEHLTANKTRAFAQNILGDTDAVTVDAWSARIALGIWDTDRAISLAGVYPAIANGYRVAAKAHKVYPATMQAATWINVRNNPTLVK